mgnify:CR=1 FL=1
MRQLACLMLLILPVTPALAEVTITGDRDVTIAVSRDCARMPGQVTCTTDTTFTGPEGQSAVKSRLRTTVPGASETVITLTGPNGETRTRKRLVTWGN